MKLNLGCGQNYKKGFRNIDINPKTFPDITLDLNKNWKKIKDNSVNYIYAKAILEHLNSYEHFFKEAHRVLEKNGVLEIIVPHYSYPDAYFPTHKHYFSAAFFIKGFNYKDGPNYGFNIKKIELIFSNNIFLQAILGFIPNLSIYKWEQIIGKAAGINILLEKKAG